MIYYYLFGDQWLYAQAFIGLIFAAAAGLIFVVVKAWKSMRAKSAQRAAQAAQGGE